MPLRKRHKRWSEILGYITPLANEMREAQLRGSLISFFAIIEVKTVNRGFTKFIYTRGVMLWRICM